MFKDRFLIQFKKHLPSSNARQTYMHIYYYDNVSFEEAMATAQPPQFRLASYPSYFVLQEIPSILISPSFEYFYNDPSVFRGKFSCPVQPGQQVQNSVSWHFLWVSTLQHPPCTDVQNFWGAEIQLLPGVQPMPLSNKAIQDNIFGLFKNITRKKAAILARQEVKEYCQKK